MGRAFVKRSMGRKEMPARRRKKGEMHKEENNMVKAEGRKGR